MAAKLTRQVRRLIGYMLAVIAMMGQTGVILICLAVILRGFGFATDLLSGINHRGV